MKKTSSISKVLIILLVTAFMVSCGTSKKTTKAGIADFAGNYEWLVEGTPDGDQNGNMILKKTESGYTGELEVMGNSIPIDGVKFEGNKMTGSIDIEGQMVLDISIVFEGDSFKGDISAMGETFPFTGKKVK